MASLLKRYGWYEWVCHTNFSFLIGASHPHEYVESAAAYGYSGLAVTDYDGVYGTARTYRAVKQAKKLRRADGLTLYTGAELHLDKDHHLPLIYQDTIILIAKSRKGYANLCGLLSRSHKDGKHDAYVTFTDFLCSELTDIVALYPMRGLIRRKSPAVVAHRWKILKEIFGGNFYALVTRCLNPSEDIWITPTLDLAHQLDIPIIFSQDAFMHSSAAKDISDVLQAMRCRKSLDDAVPQMFVNGERSLHSLEHLDYIYAKFSCYEQALKNSKTLAESCHFDLSELRYQYPKEMIPSGYTAQAYLEELVWKNAREQYGEVSQKIADLLRKEFALIAQLQFADYFLTVWDIVRWARSQNILCQGRGSAANSAVCYTLGITAVDPNHFEVLFERFLSLERGDPPDIDVDFEHERREEVIQYIYQRYGRGRAAMVANVISFKTKGAIRFVGKALGMPSDVIDAASKYLEIRQHRRQTMADIFKEITRDKPALSFLSKRFELWATLAQRIKGFPRHLGIHSGGFMITEDQIDYFVAQEPATMEGRTVVQWCKEDIEALNFFKIDILALGMLTAIRKTFTFIKQHHQQDLTLDSIPAGDRPTYAMIQKADTIGVFQIESRAQMSMLPRLKPQCFYDLVVEVAIIRPGPIQGGVIHPYLRRRDGKEAVTYMHAKLEQALKRTLGVPIFQEQVMRIAMDVGDFTPGEADELRRHMGSWQIKGDLGPWIGRLRSGMARHGIADVFIEQLVGQLRGFAEYGFPESHAASFALLAYASSFIKCHYPAAFCAALLNSQPMGFYSPHALIRDVMRHGVGVLPVCVQQSEWDTTLEQTEQGLAIRLGFRLVHSFRKSAADQVLEQRRRCGLWQSLDHFLQNCGLTRADLSSLAAADALRLFGVDRRGAVWLSEAAGFSPYLEDLDLWHEFKKETSYEAIQQDFRATSTTLGPHPAAVIKKDCWAYAAPVKTLILAESLTTLKEGRDVFVFGMVLVRQSPPSAKGMVFFTLEDETGVINVVFTPQVYAKYIKLIHAHGFLCVSGRLQRQGDAHSILTKHVYEPLVQKAEIIPMPGIGDFEAAMDIELYPARNYM